MIFCKNTIFIFLLIGALFCCSFAKDSQHYYTMAPTIAWHNYKAMNIQVNNLSYQTSDASSNNNARDYMKKVGNSIEKDVKEGSETMLLQMLGITALIIVIPIIIYNIGKNMTYSENPLHNKFVHSSQRYKEEFIQVRISPTMNLNNSSAGINAFILF